MENINNCLSLQVAILFLDEVMDILCEMKLIGSLYIQNASVAMTPLSSSLL